MCEFRVSGTESLEGENAPSENRNQLMAIMCRGRVRVRGAGKEKAKPGTGKEKRGSSLADGSIYPIDLGSSVQIIVGV